MQLEDAAAAALAQLQGEAGGPLPGTLRGMIDLFGGGTAGKSELARELAAERGIKYESARRNIERYTTEKEGAERRTPKRLLGDLAKVVQRRYNQRLIDKAKDGVIAAFSGYVRISNDERTRTFTVHIPGPDMAAFLAEAMGHHWRRAADELNYAVLNTWDDGRGHITGHNGVITEVDTLRVSFAGPSDGSAGA